MYFSDLSESPYSLANEEIIRRFVPPGSHYSDGKTLRLRTKDKVTVYLQRGRKRIRIKTRLAIDTGADYSIISNTLLDHEDIGGARKLFGFDDEWLDTRIVKAELLHPAFPKHSLFTGLAAWAWTGFPGVMLGLRDLHSLRAQMTVDWKAGSLSLKPQR